MLSCGIKLLINVYVSVSMCLCVLSSLSFMQMYQWVLCWVSPSPGSVTDSTTLHFKTLTATDLCVTERLFPPHRSANWPTPTTSCPCRAAVTRSYSLLVSFILGYTAFLLILVFAPLGLGRTLIVIVYHLNCIMAIFFLQGDTSHMADFFNQNVKFLLNSSLNT